MLRFLIDQIVLGSYDSIQVHIILGQFFCIKRTSCYVPINGLVMTLCPVFRRFTYLWWHFCLKLIVFTTFCHNDIALSQFSKKSIFGHLCNSNFYQNRTIGISRYDFKNEYINIHGRWAILTDLNRLRWVKIARRPCAACRWLCR